jgi:hypothetical protein
MEYYEVQKLREVWGKKPCDHPAFEKIFYSGAFLITYSCTQCGSEFTISQKLEFDTKRQKTDAVQHTLKKHH